MADELFYACKYTPVELFAGFGTTCVLAETDVSDFEAAGVLAHPNLCGYAKGLLERLLSPDVEEVVLVTCCDAVKRVYDVLAQQPERYRFLYLLDLPHRRGPNEQALFRSRLEDLARRYGEACGRTFDIGRALASIEPARPVTEDHVTLLGAHASPALLAAASALPLPVRNATCTDRHITDAVPRDLARAEHEGLCHACGSGQATDPLGRFLDWYAKALLGQIPCMRMQSIEGRSAAFHEEGEQGIIYHTMKFCDYYGFEYAEASRESGVPLVKIETDGSSQSAGQLKTRLEAFGETLGGKAERKAKEGGSGKAVLGIDSGSTSTDAVLMDSRRNILASAIVATGAKASLAAQRAEAEVLEAAGLSPEDIGLRIATGYGRGGIPGMDATITEITCHARGAHYLMPEARSIIDIGGQDSKAIHLSPEGEVLTFAMNDKCAAGTGRFLEMMARTLELPLEDFCEKGLAWKHEVRISSMCTVFAESEVVSLVAEDTPVADIIHGLDVSVAQKTAALARRVHAEGPYLMTGGVAKNRGVVEALREALGEPVATHPASQLCGAIGAALLGMES